jgi:hypothetical protein
MRLICGNIKWIIYCFITVFYFAVTPLCYADSFASINIICNNGGIVKVTVKNIEDNQPSAGGLITWTNVTAGSAGWKVADQYIEISHLGLPESWGIQLYTDNKDVSADPKYTGTADPSGLVNVSNTILSLPMAWRITDFIISQPSNPVQRQDGSGFDDYMWHFLRDKGAADNPLTPLNDSFVNGDDYVTLWNQSGIAWNEGGRSGNPKKSYIYLAANFTMAPAGSSYGTSTLTIEAYKGISVLPIYLYKDAPKTDYPDEHGATLLNHFSPSGWMNNAGQISVDPKCKEVTPYSGTHCFKINWNGQAGADGWKWGGIVWLEPKNIWDLNGNSPTHKGYDLRGAGYLSFWARTNSANSGMQIKVYFGNSWDSCSQTPAVWRTPALNTSWQQYTISVAEKDMSNVTGGLAVVFADDHDPDPDGCVIYLDDIKFDKY